MSDDEVSLPGMPSRSELTEAMTRVTQSLEKVRSRLHELRSKRDEINVEVKQLVAEEKILEQMSRAGARKESR